MSQLESASPHFSSQSTEPLHRLPVVVRIGDATYGVWTPHEARVIGCLRLCPPLMGAQLSINYANDERVKYNELGSFNGHS
jgi:hypothetical protein